MHVKSKRSDLCLFTGFICGFNANFVFSSAYDDPNGSGVTDCPRLLAEYDAKNARKQLNAWMNKIHLLFAHQAVKII